MPATGIGQASLAEKSGGKPPHSTRQKTWPDRFRSNLQIRPKSNHEQDAHATLQASNHEQDAHVTLREYPLGAVDSGEAGYRPAWFSVSSRSRISAASE
jgi:hypothetical protein